MIAFKRSIPALWTQSYDRADIITAIGYGNELGIHADGRTQEGTKKVA